MPDAWLEWNGDFAVDARGGLLLADGDDLARQRLERRLLTAVQGYIWNKAYGAGLPQRIGTTFGSASATALQAIVMSQVAMESAVAPSPPPQVSVTQAAGVPGMVSIDVSYTDAATGAGISFTITV